jgi:hypothetical protein
MQSLRRKQEVIVVWILVALPLIGCRADLTKPAAIEGTWRALLMPPGGEGAQ